MSSFVFMNQHRKNPRFCYFMHNSKNAVRTRDILRYLRMLSDMIPPKAVNKQALHRHIKV